MTPRRKQIAELLNVAVDASTDDRMALVSLVREELALADWLLGDDTGTSSKWMAHVLLGGPKCEDDWPWDDDDFGRCSRLLSRFPAARTRLSEMTTRGSRSSRKVWRGLVAQWDELERLYRQPNRGGMVELCRRMREVRS